MGLNSGLSLAVRSLAGVGASSAASPPPRRRRARVVPNALDPDNSREAPGAKPPASDTDALVASCCCFCICSKEGTPSRTLRIGFLVGLAVRSTPHRVLSLRNAFRFREVACRCTWSGDELPLAANAPPSSSSLKSLVATSDMTLPSLRCRCSGEGALDSRGGEVEGGPDGGGPPPILIWRDDVPARRCAKEVHCMAALVRRVLVVVEGGAASVSAVAPPSA